jgi:hypothetical protein
MASTVTLDGVRIAGDGSGPKTIVADLASGTITFVGAALDAPAGATCAFDASGLLATPALIDSHVHLAYFAGQEAAMARAGLSAAVDLAAPLPFVVRQAGNGTAGRPLRLRLSGPMVTSVGGYPTASWGAHGYGIECATPAQAVAAVRAVHAAGGTVLKLPLMPSGGLSEVPAAAAVAEAHRLGMTVAAHATGSADAAAALRLGVDVLAHTPTAELDAATLAGWAADGKAVVSTLRMFGGGSSSSANARNLRALHQRGARILYGTDFGNSRVAGPDVGELALMVQAGMSEAEVLAAATTEPARFWGWGSRLGALLPGADASWLLTEEGGSGGSGVGWAGGGGLAALGSPLAVFSRGQCFARGAPGRADWCTGCVMREEALPPARNHTASDGAASSNHTAGGAPPSNQTAGASLPPVHGDGHRGDQTAASGSNGEPWAVLVAALVALVALWAAWRWHRLRKALAAAPRERLDPAGAAGAGPSAIVVLGGDHNGPQAATL